MRPPEDFELESLMHPNSRNDGDDGLLDDDGPDAPLAMARSSSSLSLDQNQRPQSRFPRPKWLPSSLTGPFSSSASSSSNRPWSWLVRLLRPRLTVRYIIFTTLTVLVTFRLVTSRHLLANPLPTRYTGPYGVGAMDLEIPLPGGGILVNDSAVLSASGRPAFEAETLLATLYYPTDPSFRSRRDRYYWIPKPIALTARGYARFAGVDNFILRPVFTLGLWAIGGSITIPAEVDAPLSAGEDGRERLPLIVFSHGFASSRTDYTHYVGELASRGHVVAALEHRDGSSPGSLVTYVPSEEDPTPDREVLPLRESDLSNPMDTPSFKRHQLAIRDAEIQAAIDAFAAIDADPAPVAAANARSPRSRPYTTLDGWRGRLDLHRLVVAGHSYGATGALQALTTTNLPSSSLSSSSSIDGGDADKQPEKKKSTKPQAGIILDPGKSSGPLNNETTQPLLIIHSNSWSRTISPFLGRPHFDTVRDLARASNARASAAAWFLTSIGTSHPSVTDAPLLEPLLLAWTTGASLDVREALEEYVRASAEFLDYLASGDRGTLLNEAPTHDEYGKWVSEERESEFPENLARLWEIHVSPKK